MSTIPVISLEQIKSAVTEDDILDAVEGALIAHAKGMVNSPPPGSLQFEDPKGELHIKYGHLSGSSSFVVKIASGFYDNPKRGLPVSNGTMLVFDAGTGAPVCILDDKGWLTNARTAAAGALAAKAGALTNVSRVGMVGTGEQAELQAAWTCRLLGLQAISVYGRTPSHVKNYADRMERSGFSVTAAPDSASLLKTCRLVITTTPSTTALITADDVLPGTHIVAMGSDTPGKQELSADLFARAAVIMVDDHDQCVHHGELGHAVRAGLIPERADINLGRVLSGEEPGRISDSDITIADLTGIAAEDIAVATLVWSRLR